MSSEKLTWLKILGNSSFAERLKSARINKNLTQLEVAENVRVKNAYISQLESGKKPPPRQWLIEKICKFLEISEDWLLTGREESDSVGENDTLYDLHGGWKKANIEEKMGFPENHEIWRAFKLLSEIYESGEEIYVRAIFSNLVAFRDAIRYKLEREKNDERIREIEKLIKVMDEKYEKNHQDKSAPAKENDNQK